MCAHPAIAGNVAKQAIRMMVFMIIPPNQVAEE
jgi:hypothetical protein